VTVSITVATESIPDFSDTNTDKEYFTSTAVTERLPEVTGGNTPLRYRLTPDLPAGLTFNTVTRVISGTPTTAMSNTAYMYTVEDKNRDTDELTFSITVREPDIVPTFGGETVTERKYIIGKTVTETLPVAAGGNTPLRYRLTPALPAGLTFNAATRVISGTPTTATPETTYTYTVNDNDGDTAEVMLEITVETDSMPDFDSTTIPTQVYTAGSSFTLPAAAGGNTPLRYSITPPLPDGLRFNSNTRVITGTPAKASSGTYTYTVTDRNGDTDEVNFMLNVEDPPATAGGGGCAISDQNDVVSDLLAVIACLMLIPVAVVIRRNRRSQIKT